MKRLLPTLWLCAGLLAASATLAQPAKPIGEASIGLSKGSVFDVPTPQPFTADGKGASGAARAAYGAPPLVPHSVDDYLPIGVDKNACIGCHDRPGSKKAKGQATTMPPTHYVKTDGKPRVSGDYYNCGLCHAPAAAVPDLVGNKAPKPAR